MPLFCDVVAADAVGTTVGSVETVGTIELNKDAKRVLAFLSQTVSTAVMTTAEALMGKLIVNSKGLGLTDFEFGAGINLGGAPATNEQAIDSLMIKKNLDLHGDFGKVDVDVEYDAIAPEPTSEVATQFFVVYDDGSTPQNVIDALWRNYELPVDHCERCSDDEIGDLASEAMDETITFDGAYSKVIGYLANVAPDAVATAGEHFLGYTEWVATFRGITPQKWPLPAINASLGTPVGSPVRVHPIILPWFLEKGNAKETLTPTAKIQATTSGGNAVQVTLGAQK